jgi:hydroxyacylglutathione hydrolase
LLQGFETNTWLVWDNALKDAILIDPSAPSEKLLRFIEANQLSVKYIINTHGHADHIGGNGFFKTALQAKLCIHSSDAEMLINSKLNLSAYMDVDLASPSADSVFVDNEELIMGLSFAKIIHTPGHTTGCICVLIDNLLFSGDTLFHLDIGRTDLPGGDYKSIIDSVQSKLFTLPKETIVLPGHGQSSTISEEILYNPYLMS